MYNGCDYGHPSLPCPPTTGRSCYSLLSRDAPRAEKELEDTKVIFEAMNDQLMEELPQLVDLRIPYLDPSFEAMVRMQARFAEEGYEKMGGVQRFFAEGVREDYADGQLDAQVSEGDILARAWRWSAF